MSTHQKNLQRLVSSTIFVVALAVSSASAQTQPTVKISVSPANIGENAGAATVTATLSAASSQTVTVPLVFSGIATEGTDYTTSGSQIVIAAGALSSSVSISTIDDALDEDNERIAVSRGAPVNAKGLAPATVSLQISDDDPAPKATLSISSSNVAESGGTVTLSATLSGLSGRMVSVPLSFSGTAERDLDYSASADQINVAPGSLSGSLTLTLNDDSANEVLEKLTVTRGTPVNAGANAPVSVSANITDNDPLPTVSLSISAQSLPENGGSASVTATLSAASGKLITIPLQVSGSATKGIDYANSADEIVIAPGDSSGNIALTSIDDLWDEVEERIVVSIGKPTNAKAISPTSASAAVSDDDPLPSLNLSSSAITLEEQGGGAVVTASLSEPSARDVTAQLTFAGTATRNSDYQSSAVQFTFLAGQTSATLTLTGLADGTTEPTEQIALRLGSLTNAVAGNRPTLSIFVPGADSADDRPNIVVLMLDDGSQELMDQGAVSNYFPQLHQKLYREGTYFPNYHLTTPLCGPSRTSLLRGQFAHNTGIKTNSPAAPGSAPDTPSGGFGEFYRRGYADTDLGAKMKEAGYRSVMIGKYVNNGFPGESGSSTYTPPGWDEFHASMGGNYFGTLRLINGVRAKNPETAYRTDEERNNAVRLINEHFQSSSQRKPLFLYIAPFSPHGSLSSKGIVAPRFADNPLQCSINQSPNFNEADISDKGSFMQIFPLIDAERLTYLETFQRDRMRSILATDELFGAVFGALGEEIENTYIFFSTDNGYFMGDHRIANDKKMPYTRGISAPLVVRGPGVAAGATRDHLLMNIDLLPTLMSIANQPVPAYADGKSMLPVLRGATSPQDWRQSVLLENWESTGIGEADEESETYYYVKHPTEYSQFRTANYSYIRWANGDREYYDFLTDPYQLDNQASQLSASRLAQLDALLDQWVQCAAAGCRAAGEVPAP